jgi:radical SAM protein (TIGR01212 family)
MSYYSVSDFYKKLFGSKVYKITLDAGCTCPVRDGSLDSRGCIFCSQNGSGDFVPSRLLTIPRQIEEAKKLVESKMSKSSKQSSDHKYIAYFQNFTNTYGNLGQLRQKWEQAVNYPGIVGIAIGTRPDCLSPECLAVLAELAEKTFVQVELGFQTSNEETAVYIRRHFMNDTYLDAVQALHKASSKIHVVTHIIFGLPGESSEVMMNTVRFVVAAGTDGIKIMNLYVLKNTDLALDYERGLFKALDFKEYLELLKQALSLIPKTIVIHRLTGDPPKSQLIAPDWVADKKRVLNELK